MKGQFIILFIYHFPFAVIQTCVPEKKRLTWITHIFFDFEFIYMSYHEMRINKIHIEQNLVAA